MSERPSNVLATASGVPESPMVALADDSCSCDQSQPHPTLEAAPPFVTLLVTQLRSTKTNGPEFDSQRAAVLPRPTR
ncbi:Hypp8809 [Branchiostoma lanceolatum]|uniref:Hypp8809 protein n=1 Tax=Branchiostoma lanceolatum TaxID=7740 RepID=A0A8K0EFZ8_BRALA|nr:Hypp8809 [Branchiostoma lanceolatum]